MGSFKPRNGIDRFKDETKVLIAYVLWLMIVGEQKNKESLYLWILA